MRTEVTEEPHPGEPNNRSCISARCKSCQQFVHMKVCTDDLIAWKQGHNPKVVFPYLCDEHQVMLITGKCDDCLNPSKKPKVE